MNQSKKPLLEALLTHIKHDPVSYHVPGHKYGALLESDYFAGIMRIDATELSGLDDLHSPEGPIMEAEQLLSSLYGVERSFFLVNGTTAGNLAMVLASCREGDIVLVQRNCHKSIFNALRLAKAQPVFIEPAYGGPWKIAAGLSEQAVEAAIAKYPDAKGLILTYPNYYGIAGEICGIIDAAHRNGIPVLVDEAHGAHFIAGDPFPASAATMGADIVVQSAHKTLPALTMGSYLHFNSQLVPLGRLSDYLQAVQSSSPSYPIMASLDIARSYLGTYGREDKEWLIEETASFRDRLKEIPQIRVLDYEDAGDPLKLTIQTACGLNGYEIQKVLERAGIYTELADPNNVLFVLPLLKKGMPYPFTETAEKVAESLKEYPAQPGRAEELSMGGAISTLALSYQEMDRLSHEPIRLKDAEGRVSAETIIPYPPGVPLILKGERITGPIIETLEKMKDEGARFQGGERLQAKEVNVFKIENQYC